MALDAPKVEWDASEVVARVAKHIRAGASFELAWTMMLQEVRRPSLRRAGQTQMTLMSDDPDELDQVDAMRGFCADAYYGRRPALAGFDLSILRGGDWSSAAHRAGEIRTAA